MHPTDLALPLGLIILTAGFWLISLALGLVALGGSLVLFWFVSGDEA